MGQKALKPTATADTGVFTQKRALRPLRIASEEGAMGSFSPVHELQARLSNELSKQPASAAIRDHRAFLIGMGLMTGSSAAAWFVVATVLKALTH